MTLPQTGERVPPKPLRLWPGVLIAALVVLARFVAPLVHPDAAIVGVLGALAGLLAIILWWLFFSRAPLPDRLIAIVAMAAAVAATYPLLHESLSTGMMGMLFFIFAVPVTLSLAFVGWAATAGHLPDRPRRLTMAAAIVLACGVWLLFRTDGILGGTSQLAWRWTPTAEERLLAQAANEPLPTITPAATDAGTAAAPVPAPDQAPAVEGAAAGASGVARPAPTAAAPVPRAWLPSWSGFRGPARDGIVRGLHIETEWARMPPIALWRHPIGPGWSSFAVDGDLIYTQEQRGEEELVTAYRFSTGDPVWRHADPVRFWESNAGAGPRATPAVHDGVVYAMGATGIVNALDASTGARLWSRSAAADTGATMPDWGFAGSPLVADGLVIVAASGRLVAYDAHSGEPRWLGPEGGSGYSSPHLVTMARSWRTRRTARAGGSPKYRRIVARRQAVRLA
jgi:outer membrane protein assembly factor BamB